MMRVRGTCFLPLLRQMTVIRQLGKRLDVYLMVSFSRTVRLMWELGLGERMQCLKLLWFVCVMFLCL